MSVADDAALGEVQRLTISPGHVIGRMRYSPSGRYLAVGSHNNNIYLLDAAHQTYGMHRRLSGHSSYVTHVDWSRDDRVLQSSCGAYEILYWDVEKGCTFRSTKDSVESDTAWASFTLTLGFPVMGIFGRDSDGTDVNSCHRAPDGRFVVAADDNGNVNLFHNPVTCRWAAHRSYEGHSSHCLGVRFTCDSKRVVSAGGRDAALVVWNVTDNFANDHSGDVAERANIPASARPAWMAGCDLKTSTDILRKARPML